MALRVKDSRTAPPRVGCLSLEPSRRKKLCPKTGLEPVIALLEGKCLNHLNYSGSYNCCMRLFKKGGIWRTNWSGWRDLNPRPFEWQSNALPAEPQPHIDPMVSRVIDLLDLYIPREGFTSLPLGGDIQNRTEDERLQSSRFTIKLYRQISFPEDLNLSTPITTL